MEPIWDDRKRLIPRATLLFGYITVVVVTINTLKTKRRLLHLKIQFVPRSKHFISVIKTNRFMIHGAKVAICSEIN